MRNPQYCLHWALVSRGSATCCSTAGVVSAAREHRGRQRPHGPRGWGREGNGDGDGDGDAVPEASVSPQPVVTQVRPPGKSSVAWGRQTGDTRAFSCAGVASLISVMSLRMVSQLKLGFRKTCSRRQRSQCPHPRLGQWAPMGTHRDPRAQMPASRTDGCRGHPRDWWGPQGWMATPGLLGTHAPGTPQGLVGPWVKPQGTALGLLGAREQGSRPRAHHQHHGDSRTATFPTVAAAQGPWGAQDDGSSPSVGTLGIMDIPRGQQPWGLLGTRAKEPRPWGDGDTVGNQTQR